MLYITLFLICLFAEFIIFACMLSGFPCFGQLLSASACVRMFVNMYVCVYVCMHMACMHSHLAFITNPQRAHSTPRQTKFVFIFCYCCCFCCCGCCRTLRCNFWIRKWFYTARCCRLTFRLTCEVSICSVACTCLGGYAPRACFVIGCMAAHALLHCSWRCCLSTVVCEFLFTFCCLFLHVCISCIFAL